MELKIKKGEFLSLLRWTQGIAEKRGTMPILSNLLLEAGTPGLFRLAATDLEISVGANGHAEVKTAGKLVLNAKNLYEIVREAPEDSLLLTRKGDHGAEIVSGKSRFRLVGMNPEEFPSIPKSSNLDFSPLDAAQMEEMVAKTFYAASTDETRFTLNGLFFSQLTRGDQSILRVVATDGHRLSYVERETGKKWKLDKGIIVPRKGIAEIKKLLADGKGDLGLAVDDKSIHFRRGEITLVVRLIEGDFPAYEQVIPKKTEKVVSVGREILMGALRRAAIMTSETGRGVQFGFESGRLEIKSSNPDMGEATDEIAIDYNGTKFSVGFNPRYFLDLLGIMEDEKVVLELKDEVSPCVIRSEFDRGFLALVMPMRI